MMTDKSYTKAFWAALVFHLLIGCMLFYESSNSKPSLRQETIDEAGAATAKDMAQKAAPETIKAVSLPSQEVMETVNRLKEERAKQIKAEQSRQQALVKQADEAKNARLLEQKRLAKLKDEAEKAAVLRKKEIAEEQKHLEQLAKQKAEEAARLAKLKKAEEALEKKQKEEASKLAVLKKKEQEQAQAVKAKARAEAAAAAKFDALAKTRAAAEAKAQAAALASEREARAEAAANATMQRAKMTGEVDKYKALIRQAIGQRWIQPEDVDRSLSCQFRIRLAPDGAVLEVSLIRSSGDALLDRSAETAILKASPLPVPSDPALFDIFRDISLTVRPENIRG